MSATLPPPDLFSKGLVGNLDPDHSDPELDDLQY